MRLLVLLPLLAGACMEYEYTRFDGTDVFYQKPADKVDILMVVDNSCSMLPYQVKLASNFQAFMTFFIDVDVDYHIGVTTTSVVEPVPNPGAGCTVASLADIPDPGHLVGDTFITTDTEDAEELFSDLVNVGICGSGTEMGLEAASLAVSEGQDSGVSEGFLRDDAQLSLVIVSDEQDSSPLAVAHYINNYRDIKGERNRDTFNASSLVVLNANNCSQDQRNSGATEGSRYVDVAQQSNGILGDICSDDFESIVTDLSLNSSRLVDTFYLSNLPDPTTLAVSVDSTGYACDEGVWTYLLEEGEEGEDVPVVVFSRDHLPPPSSQVAIRYYDGDGDPSAFCGGDSAEEDTR